MGGTGLNYNFFGLKNFGVVAFRECKCRSEFISSSVYSHTRQETMYNLFLHAMFPRNGLIQMPQ